MNSLKIKYLKFGVIGLILLTVGSQIYSLVNMKGFWLDEWFILYNIKFHSYSGLFGNLFYMQQFPRIYLCIVKFISELFNYNYFAIRVLPFSIQVINVLLVYFLISKIVFPNSKLKAFLFILFFLSFHTTIFYFSQLKAYTMDIFFTFMSIWYFYYLSRNYKTIKIKSFGYVGMLFFIFSGSFFSYTFPIVVTPILFIFLITFLSEFFKGKLSLKPLIPIVIFMVALVLNYFTDLKFVLTNKGQYQNFDMYVMQYHSLGSIIKSLFNIVWIFTSMFFFDKAYNTYFLGLLYFVKIIVLISALSGFLLVFYRNFIKLKIKKIKYFSTISYFNAPGIEIYLLGLFFATLVLYFLKMLPVGTHRINYFCFTFSTYFLITGVFFIISKYNRIKYFLLPIILFASIFPTIRMNINEINGSDMDFDQKIYVNVGKAVLAAQSVHLPIIVSYNEFYPASIMEGQESLMIKAHHDYKPKDSIPVFVINKNEMVATLKNLKIDRYIFITKYNYKTVLP